MPCWACLLPSLAFLTKHRYETAANNGRKLLQTWGLTQQAGRMVVLRRAVALLGRMGGSTPLMYDALGQPAWLAALVGSRNNSGGSRSVYALAAPSIAADIMPCSLGSRWTAGAAGSQLTAGAAAAAAGVAASSPTQLLHLRAFAAGSGRTAALRRLRRAGARAAAGSRASREAAAARVAAGGGDVEAGPATDVVPQEGPASELQVASAVDHPALIITRPVEWCVRPHACAARRHRAATGCAAWRFAVCRSKAIAAPPAVQGHRAAGL